MGTANTKERQVKVDATKKKAEKNAAAEKTAAELSSRTTGGSSNNLRYDSLPNDKTLYSSVLAAAGKKNAAVEAAAAKKTAEEKAAAPQATAELSSRANGDPNMVRLSCLPNDKTLFALVQARPKADLQALFDAHPDAMAKKINSSIHLKKGFSMLTVAAKFNGPKKRTDIAQLLIARKADINFRDKDGLTPLMWAAWVGNAAIVKLLVQAGCDTKLKDNRYGETALDRAMTKMKEYRQKAKKRTDYENLYPNFSAIVHRLQQAAQQPQQASSSSTNIDTKTVRVPTSSVGQSISNSGDSSCSFSSNTSFSMLSDTIDDGSGQATATSNGGNNDHKDDNASVRSVSTSRNRVATYANLSTVSSDWNSKPMIDWGTDDVFSFICGIGQASAWPEYAELFRQNGIDGTTLESYDSKNELMDDIADFGGKMNAAHARALFRLIQQHIKMATYM